MSRQGRGANDWTVPRYTAEGLHLPLPVRIKRKVEDNDAAVTYHRHGCPMLDPMDYTRSSEGVKKGHSSRTWRETAAHVWLCCAGIW